MLSGQWGGSGEGELRQARMDTEPHAVWGAHRGKDTQTRVSRLSSPCCYIKYGLCKAFHVWQVLSCYAGTATIPFLTTTLDSLLIFEQLSSAMPCFLCTFFSPQHLVFNSLTNCLGPRKLLHSGRLYKTKSSRELWAFLFSDFLLLTHSAKPFSSSGSDKLFSPKTSIQLKMYKTVS